MVRAIRRAQRIVMDVPLHTFQKIRTFVEPSLSYVMQVCNDKDCCKLYEHFYDRCSLINYFNFYVLPTLF